MRIIGVAGGSGSGKTTLVKMLASRLGDNRTVTISQDNYYKDQSQKFDGDGNSVNFDHPDSLDWALLVEHLLALKSGKEILMPCYDFASHRRLAGRQNVMPKEYILVDGILIFTNKNVFDVMDQKIFVDTREEIRFARRLRRDVEERGRTPEGVKNQYVKQVKPMHDLFVEPTRNVADLILSGESSFEEFLISYVNSVK